MADAPLYEITTSRQMLAWMAEQKVSLGLTTYQVGKLFLLGLQPDGRLEIFNRTFSRCMGLAAEGDSLYLSTLYQLWRFENTLAPGATHKGYDRVYVPQVAWTTGDIDIHDIVVVDGRPVFASTLFSCAASVSERYSFTPYWRPPFISKLAAEDRCHLNGLAAVDGKPRFATCVSKSDVADGWRDHRTDGGLVVDMDSNEIVVAGLSMPHSPRWHRDKLWLIDSGNGYFGYVDMQSGKFEPVTFCPGYGRGLAFVGDFAVVGLSRPRHDGSFAGLKLDAELLGRSAEARCGLLVIDLRTGDAVHWVRIKGLIEELYDVAVLPGVTRPMAIGTKTDEIRRVLSVPPAD